MIPVRVDRSVDFRRRDSVEWRDRRPLPSYLPKKQKRFRGTCNALSGERREVHFFGLAKRGKPRQQVSHSPH